MEYGKTGNLAKAQLLYQANYRLIELRAWSMEYRIWRMVESIERGAWSGELKPASSPSFQSPGKPKNFLLIMVFKNPWVGQSKT